MTAELLADVVVIGAGPAGVSAAIHLARTGFDVAVIDRARFPRDKVCGDGLTTSALHELQRVGVEPADVDGWTPVRSVILQAPSGRRANLPLPDGPGDFAAVATRHDLDAALVRRAVKEGVRLFEGLTLETVTPGADHVEVVAGGRAFRSPWLVAADGMWSPTRKLLGLSSPGYLGEWHAFRQYFEGVDGPAASQLTVAFERDLLPGYFWAFPLGQGRANVGYGILRRRGAATGSMKQQWPDLLARPSLRSLIGEGAHPVGMHRAWPIPARIDLIPAAGRTFFVGDAVAACDPMTGEGIGQALATGRMAAGAIAAAGSADEARRRYAEDLRYELHRDNRFAGQLGRALSHAWVVDSTTAILAGSSWAASRFGRWLFEGYPRALLLTPRRWRRGAMSGPGAYT